MRRLAGFAVIAVALLLGAFSQADTAGAQTAEPFNPESEPAGYAHWPAYELDRPKGVEYLAPSGPVRRAIEFRVADLNDEWNNINDNGTDTQSQLTRAMDMLQLGMYWDETFSDGILSGRVTAEDGDHFFDISFTDASKSTLRLIQIAVDEDGRPLEGAAAEARRTPGTSTMARLSRPLPAARPQPVETSARRAAAPGAVANTAMSAEPGGTGRYGAPKSHAEINTWPLLPGQQNPLFRSPDPDDPTAPIGFYLQSGPEYGVRTFRDMVEKIDEMSPIENIGDPTWRSVPTFKLAQGREANFILQKTRRGVMVAMLVQAEDDYRDIVALGYEVTEADFIASGGFLNMLNIRNNSAAYDSLSDATRTEFARQSFDYQLDNYNALIGGLASIASDNLLRTMELSYDVLNGDDITSPLIAD